MTSGASFVFSPCTFDHWGFACWLVTKNIFQWKERRHLALHFETWCAVKFASEVGENWEEKVEDEFKKRWKRTFWLMTPQNKEQVFLCLLSVKSSQYVYDIRILRQKKWGCKSQNMSDEQTTMPETEKPTLAACELCLSSPPQSRLPSVWRQLTVSLITNLYFWSSCTPISLWFNVKHSWLDLDWKIDVIKGLNRRYPYGQKHLFYLKIGNKWSLLVLDPDVQLQGNKCKSWYALLMTKYHRAWEKWNSYWSRGDLHEHSPKDVDSVTIQNTIKSNTFSLVVCLKQNSELMYKLCCLKLTGLCLEQNNVLYFNLFTLFYKILVTVTLTLVQ